VNDPGYFAHPTAVIETPVAIGHRTRIWHFTHVMAGADIGRDCTLGQNVFVAATVRVGDRVKVQNNVSLYDGVELDDDVFCGPSAVFTNVTHPRAAFNRRDRFQPTRVCLGVTVGANATIVAGVTIGRYAFIGAGATVTKDVQPYALMVGVPASQVGWVGQHGYRLRPGDGALLVCPESGWRYREAPEGVLRRVDGKEDGVFRAGDSGSL